jgi:RNA polymerase sigma-32 factor
MNPMTTAVALRQTTLPALLASSLDAYLQQVARIPVLDVAEEQALARELRDKSNLAAAQKLILSNLRFVVHIARGYQGYGLGMADLIQEGNVGLMKAVKRFDADKGVRLISFAVHWIKAEIHEYILKNWRIVKIATTKAQRKLFFNLRSAKRRLGWMNDVEVRAIAKDLNVKPEEVRQMEARLGMGDMSFSATPSEGEEAYMPEDYLADSRNDIAAIEEAEWQEAREARMRQALVLLNDRERDILARRWLADDHQKAGLQELGDEYGVSAERIRQIETAAMKKLRKAIEVA